MIDISLPESIKGIIKITTDSKNLNDILLEISSVNPDAFKLIAIEKNESCKLKPFITLFINNAMSVDSNPVLTDGDHLTFEVAISGG
ncbi:MoaD/ThiS family protein [Dickeya undicola]|uniref:MoaD/ThiS family protein n=1 Tax=Dickeya undicola TaxID=1577887 RepID=UPI000532F557|nr:MoaD/ThiS family protein [Dickeya undicola]